MDKSPDAFKTISEVAEELDLPQHVLRFWETRFSQIKLLKRGGGRRYYRPDDVDLLRGIRHFLYGEGYTIKGLQRILKEEGAAFVQAVGRGEIIPSAAPQAVSQEVVATPFQEEIFEQVSPAPFPQTHSVSFTAEPQGMQGNLFTPAPQTHPVPPERLSARKVRVLKAVLEDLQECKRVLEGLKLSG